MRFFLFLFPLFALGQVESVDMRFEAAKVIFDRDLIRNFIHPQQLNAKNRKLCEQYIAHMINRYDADFVAVRFEKAFQQSDATDVFFPVFIFTDSTEISMPPFRILQ